QVVHRGAGNEAHRCPAFRLVLRRDGSPVSVAGPRGGSGLGPETEAIGLADHLSHRARLRLLHHASAVELHRLLTDPEVTGNLLIESALDDEPEHVSLARGQRVEALANRRQLRPFPARLAIVAKGPVDDVEQRLIAEGLL